MKQVTKTYNVYSFDELSDKVKEKVVNNHIQFFLECYAYENMSENMRKAIDEAERMLTPWFVGSYIWEYCKGEILDECRSFDYLPDGKIFAD